MGPAFKAAREPIWLLLPIETKVRELHGKCLLAAVAAEAGMRVLLGDLKMMARSAHRLPSGIFLDKSVSPTRTARYARLKRLGFSIAAWCEEGLVYRNKRAYQAERVSRPSLAHVDSFFAWGEIQRNDVLEVAPEAASKTIVTGNPRFDVLRPEYRTLFAGEVEGLLRRYDPYILVNTNFSRFNRFLERESVVDTLRKRGVVRSEADELFYHRLSEHLGALFDEFRVAIAAIARMFPQLRVVVRPHPSEDHGRWRSALADVPNAVVIHEGSVIPWIIGAKMVIHNSCTTGVEAFLLDRRTVAYLPISDEELDSRLPNYLSEVAHDQNALMTLVRDTIENDHCRRSSSAGQRHLLSRYVANAEGPLACEGIIQTLCDRDLKRGRAAARGLNRAFLATRAAVAAAVRRFREDRQMVAYTNQKFPGLSLEELKPIMEDIATIRGTAVAPVAAHPSLPNCFVVQPMTRQFDAVPSVTRH